jgi:hypothetical protein
MRFLGVPVPSYRGFSLFTNWVRLPAIEKVRSIAGTLKRIVLKGWTKPLKSAVPGSEFPQAGYVGEPVIGIDKAGL